MKQKSTSTKENLDLLDEEKRTNILSQDWENTFDTISDMITVHDEDYNILAANRAARKMLKLDMSKPLNKKCYSYYHGGSKPPENCKSCASLKTGQPCEFEFYEPHLKRFIEVRVLPRIDRKKNIKGLIHIVRDITERKKTEESLLRSKQELRTKAKSLEDSNTALTVLLDRRDKLRSELEEKISLNLNSLVIPFLNKISKENSMKDNLKYIEIARSNIDNIISTFSLKLTNKYHGLTATEIQVANLIKDGKQSKAIADILNISYETVNSHRQNIRKKLGIRSKKVNLKTFLRSLSD